MGRKIFIADADLIGKKRHRFPNLTCMKIAMSHLELGDEIIRVKKWNDILQKGKDDWAYISKVFTDTYVPDFVLQHMDESPENFYIGGTGFYFDKAEMLPDYMEHSMPYYEYYDGLAKGEYYKDYSIGFLTRGCIRHCPFCVNQNSNASVPWSPLKEFMAESRKKLCFLDDNFFACKDWREILEEVIFTGKPFRFHQGLDIRLLDDERASVLLTGKYDGDITFAFDNVREAPIIERKIQLLRRHTGRNNIRFYVLCGFEGTDISDLDGVFKRIEILGKYGMLPYIMRYRGPYGEPPWRTSPLKGMYSTIARWANQPQYFKKKSLWEFAKHESDYLGRKSASEKHIEEFVRMYPDRRRYVEQRFYQA